MKDDKSIFTQAGEEVGEFLFSLNDEIKKIAPIPFGQRKVGSPEITRQVAKTFNEQGQVDPVKLLPVVQQYGYGAVNEILGRIITRREQNGNK